MDGWRAALKAEDFTKVIYLASKFNINVHFFFFFPQKKM